MRAWGHAFPCQSMETILAELAAVRISAVRLVSGNPADGLLDTGPDKQTARNYWKGKAGAEKRRGHAEGFGRVASLILSPSSTGLRT